MADRYYSDDPLEGIQATLRGNEAHHLLHVMRAKVGSEIIVFDGWGGEWWAEITKLGRAEVELALKQHRPVERELATPLVLGIALPKGDRQRWLIEKAVELGVTRLVPIVTSRSNSSTAEPPAKLARYVVEASKQSGRNRLMEIDKPLAWAQFVNQNWGQSKLLAHPGGKSVGDFPSDKTSIALAVGPEGGFTDEEVELAQTNGWSLVGLGERILRIETAAIALIARLTLA